MSVFCPPKTVHAALEYQQLYAGNVDDRAFDFIQQHAQQYQELPADHREEGRWLAPPAGDGFVDPHMDLVDGAQNIAGIPVIPEAALGAAGVAGAKILWEGAKFVTPKAVRWFRKHHDKAHESPPHTFTWKKFEFTVIKISQYIVPMAVGGLIIWQLADPGGQAKLIVAGGGVVLQFMATKRGNSLAKDINDVITQYAADQGLAYGIAAANPTLANEAAVSIPQADNTLVEGEQPPAKKRWYHYFTSPCGCFEACRNYFRSNNNQEALVPDLEAGNVNAEDDRQAAGEPAGEGEENGSRELQDVVVVRNDNLEDEL